MDLLFVCVYMWQLHQNVYTYWDFIWCRLNEILSFTTPFLSVLKPAIHLCEMCIFGLIRSSNPFSCESFLFVTIVSIWCAWNSAQHSMDVLNCMCSLYLQCELMHAHHSKPQYYFRDSFCDDDILSLLYVETLFLS